MDRAPDSPALAAALAASREADLNPLPHAAAPPPALLPEPEPEPDSEPGSEPALDAHGFDPAAYKWLPVLRKPRQDGWTPQRQRDFIAALGETGCVRQAARAAGMTERSCYRLRRSRGAENFAAAWDAACQHAASMLVDLAFDRAINGSDEPVFDKQGNRIGRRMRPNDRLLMFLLRAYLPDRFRHAHRDVREPGEVLPRAEPPIGEMLRRLAPVVPPEPHQLLPPGELEDALFIADVGTGELPHWHRGCGDLEPGAGGYEIGDPFDDPPEDPLLD